MNIQDKLYYTMLVITSEEYHEMFAILSQKQAMSLMVTWPQLQSYRISTTEEK